MKKEKNKGKSEKKKNPPKLTAAQRRRLQREQERAELSSEDRFAAFETNPKDRSKSNHSKHSSDRFSTFDDSSDEEQDDYFDHEHVIGWVRRGDEEHPNSGIAVVLSNAEGGSVKMEMGRQFAGTRFYDAFGSTEKPVIISEDGTGEFSVGEQSVSVWVRKGARADLTINE